jgi:hypothetical protein
VVLGGLLNRYLILQYFERTTEHPDLPVPFGPRMAWLALDTGDTEAVAAALGLRGAKGASWADGIEAAHKGGLFVTPPLADWTLVAGTPLFPPERADAFVRLLLEGLSRQFQEAQYFCSHRDAGLHIYGRARKGHMVRGYGWYGQKGAVVWEEGRLTNEERDLGFNFFDGRPEAVAQAQHGNASFLDEEAVMQLAALWSIDPTTLDASFREPVAGLLGKAPWSENA